MDKIFLHGSAFKLPDIGEAYKICRSDQVSTFLLYLIGMMDWFNERLLIGNHMQLLVNAEGTLETGRIIPGRRVCG